MDLEVVHNAVHFPAVLRLAYTHWTELT